MADNPGRTPLEFSSTNEATGEQVVVAKAELATDGTLRLLTAREPERQRLAAAVQTVNAAEGLHVDAPPSESAPRNAVASRFVAKGTDEYLDAVKEYFLKYYKLIVD